MMDINNDKLRDIFELIKAYKSHRITLINDHKANDVDIECLIKGILDKNINYTCCSDGTILEITRIQEVFMRYFLVIDYGTKVMAHNLTDLYKKFGGRQRMIDENGGVMPDIEEISEEDYELDDGYDVMQHKETLLTADFQ